MRAIVFLVMVWLFSIDLMAQVNVKGQVLLSKNEVAVGAFVNLYGQDSLTFYEFVSTDVNGNYQFKNLKPGIYVLEVQMMGFKSSQLRVELLNKKEVVANFLLKEGGLILPQTLVLGKKQPIIRRGDSLVFAIDTFMNGTENDLGDVLNSTPGFKVEGDVIYFNEKKVDYIRIDGKDVLNNQHGIAIKSLQKDNIENLKLIENYKESVADEDKSNKIALDVGLKKKAQGKWLLKSDMGWGLMQRGFSYNNLINVSKKIGTGNFVKMNNTGEQLINSSDYLNLQPNQEKFFNSLTQTTSGKADFVPQELKLAGNESTNKDILVSSNLDFTKNRDSKWRTKVGILGVSFTRNAENASIKRLYFDSLGVFDASLDKQSQFKMLNINMSAQRKGGTKFYYDFFVPIKLTQANSEGLQVGRFTGSAQDLKQLDARNSWVINALPSFNSLWKLDSTSKLRTSVTLMSNYETSKVNLNSFQGFFNTTLNDLNQNIIRTSNTLLSQAIYSKSIKKLKLRFELNNQLSIATQLGSTNQDKILSLSDTAQLFQSDSRLVPGFWYDMGKFSLSGDASLVQLHTNMSNKEATTLYRAYLSKLMFRYEVSALNWFFINYTRNLAGLDLTSMSRLTIVQSQQELVFNNLNQTFTDKHAVNLGYMKMQGMGNALFYANASFALATNTLSQKSTFQNNYLTNALYLAPQSLTASLMVSKMNNLFNKKLELNIMFSTTYTNSDVILGDVPSSNIAMLALGNISLDYKIKNGFVIGVGYNGSYNTIETGLLKTSILNHQTHFRIKYKTPKIEFRAELQTALLYSQVNNKQYLLNAYLGKKLENKPITLFVQANNLLNLKEFQTKSVSATTFYSEQQFYNQIPGYLVFGLSLAL